MSRDENLQSLNSQRIQLAAEVKPLRAAFDATIENQPHAGAMRAFLQSHLPMKDGAELSLTDSAVLIEYLLSDTKHRYFTSSFERHTLSIPLAGDAWNVFKKAVCTTPE